MGRGSLVVVIVVAALLSFLAGSIPIEGRSLTVVTRGETLTFTVSLSSSGYSADLSNQPVEFYAETYDIFLGIATTDENGIAKVPITGEGEWMFLVRHRDPTKKVNEEYDESVFVSTLVMETAEEEG